ncbi:MAG: histidine phosphatase family protein [Oscillospiraceae bacterium]
MQRVRIYIVRHGETEYNVLHRFIGSTDKPLNERGCRQANCLRAPMSKLHLDAIYASPMMRTMMTACQIRGDRDMEIISVPGLREIDCGEWEGLSREEIQSRWPGMIDLWQYRPDELRMPQGETFEQVQQRGVEAFVALVKQNFGRDIAVASHMLTIQLLMARLLNVPIHNVWQMCRLENTSITSMDIWENGEFEITKWGECGHLPQELRNDNVKVAGFVTKEFSSEYDLITVSGRRYFEPFQVDESIHS